MDRRARIPLVALIAAAAVLVAATAGAQAKTFKPTRFDDPDPGRCRPNDCSLREAVLAANRRDGKDEIVLRRATSVGKIYERDPERDQLTIDDPVEIGTAGSRRKGRAMIDANGAGRVLAVEAKRVALRRLVLTGGGSTIIGGGLFVDRPAEVTVENSQIADNSAGSGGGVAAFGRVSLVRTQVYLNSGVGGGVFASGGRVEIRKSRVASNEAFTGGGVLLRESVQGASVARIDRSTITENTADEDGGGIALEGASTARVTRSTIAENYAERGGGLFATDTSRVRLTNTTLTVNRPPVEGGGIGSGIVQAGASTVSMNAVTVARNGTLAGPVLGGGIVSLIDENGGGFRIENSIIAENSADSGDDCFAPEGESLGHNLISDDGGCGGFFDFEGPDILAPDAGFGDFADHGGATETIELLRGSPAIRHAKRKTAPERDQRGVKRDRKPDIGAFER